MFFLFILFFTLQTVFIHDIKMASVRHGSRPPYPLTEPLSTPLFLLPSCALALCCRQSTATPPPPAVMIMSARLLSCQTHWIYSGLFLMFTLMLLLFTRKGGKWLRAASYTHAGVSSCRLTAWKLSASRFCVRGAQSLLMTSLCMNACFEPWFLLEIDSK